VVVGVDPEQHLAALEPGPLDGCGVVRREAVVDLEDRARQAAAVHRADRDLALQSPHQHQVLEDVGGAQHAVHPGTRERQGEAVQQPAAVGHRQAVVARAQRATGRVVGRDQHQPPRLAGQPGGLPPGGEQVGDAARSPDPGLQDLLDGAHETPASSGSRSAVLGIASAHASRAAT
jgi:hypothetical protein